MNESWRHNLKVKHVAGCDGGELVRDELEASIRHATTLEIARVLVRFDHVASAIVNANHGVT